MFLIVSTCCWKTFRFYDSRYNLLCNYWFGQVFYRHFL